MKRTSGRPFWDEALAKKETMIRAQAEEIVRLRAEIEALNALWKPAGATPRGVKAYNLSSLSPADLHAVIKKAVE